jgi:hypothetical protein
MQALWNLAFLDKNRKRIRDANGVKVLDQYYEQPLLQKAIHGIAFMLSDRPYNLFLPTHTPQYYTSLFYLKLF